MIKGSIDQISPAVLGDMNFVEVRGNSDAYKSETKVNSKLKSCIRNTFLITTFWSPSLAPLMYIRTQRALN